MDTNLSKAAQTAIQQALRVRPGERVLIVTNPVDELLEISRALEHWTKESGGQPELIVQPVKTSLDTMEETVREAFGREPEVYISISANRLGKDPVGTRQPYLGKDGKTYDAISSYLIYGKQCTRGFWSPGITKEMFCTTLPLDYAALKKDCDGLAALLTRAKAVRITTAAGTDLEFSLEGRTAFVDDGDFSQAGSGGNLPAGEAFISPVNRSAHGRLVYDGSMSVKGGTLLLKAPIVVEFEGGFISSISGREEAEVLSETIREAEENAVDFEMEGKLPQGQGKVYRENARALGELGIGVNPLASVTGNMLVDEKAARTCHLAIGQNYDLDAPALIHLDGVVLEPTLELYMEDGSSLVLMEDGEINRSLF